MHEFHSVAAQVLPALVLAALFSEGRIPLQDRVVRRDSAWLLLQFMLLAALGEVVALRVIARPAAVPAYGWETVLVSVSLLAGAVALLVPIAMELLRQLLQEYEGLAHTFLRRCILVVEEAARTARWLPVALVIAAFEPVLRQHPAAKAFGFVAYAALLLGAYLRVCLSGKLPGAGLLTRRTWRAWRILVPPLLPPALLLIIATPLYFVMSHGEFLGRPLATVAWTAFEAALLLPLVVAALLGRQHLGLGRARFLSLWALSILVADVTLSYLFPGLGATALVSDASAGTALATLANMLWWLPALVLIDAARPPKPPRDEPEMASPGRVLLPKQPIGDGAPVEQSAP